MGAEPVPHQASRDLLQERRPVDRADRVAETVAAVAVAVDDRGDAERFASSASITSITLTTNP
jgi:hypothetical protein